MNNELMTVSKTVDGSDYLMWRMLEVAVKEHQAVREPVWVRTRLDGDTDGPCGELEIGGERTIAVGGQQLNLADVQQVTFVAEQPVVVDVEPLWVSVQPEYWDNDHAVPAGPVQRFDAAPDVVAMDDDRLRLLLHEADQGALCSFDHLYESAARDRRVKGGFGFAPFSLYVDPEELAGWINRNL